MAIAPIASALSRTWAPPSLKTGLRSSHRRGLEFEPDHEEQQDHPEFRKVENGVGVCDECQAPRADRHPGHQVAKHRTETARRARGS